MYLLIDYDEMIVKGKHPNFSHLCEYGVLVCSESACVLPLGAKHLENEYTDVQLQKLYINTTGIKDGALYAKAVLCKVLAFYFNAMPETILNSDISDQAQYAIDNNLEGYCQYKPGKQVPVALTTPIPAYTTQPSPNEPAIASGQLVVTPPQPIQAPYAPTREVANATPRVSTGEAPTARASGAKEQIYEVADAMWADAGKPTDKPTVLKLRKSIMDALEQVGVKRNTSSNTLGKWHMERAPF